MNFVNIVVKLILNIVMSITNLSPGITDPLQALCLETNATELYRKQVGCLLERWEDYSAPQESGLSDAEAIWMALQQDWTECQRLFAEGKLEPQRILEADQIALYRDLKKDAKISAKMIQEIFFSSFDLSPSFPVRAMAGAPRGIHNLGADCFLNALFQVIWSQTPVCREALFQKHPNLQVYFDTYESENPMTLHEIRFYLAELSGDNAWLEGQHDPQEAMLVLMADLEENPLQTLVVNTKHYTPTVGTIIPVEDLEQIQSIDPSITTMLSVPESVSSLSFNDLLTNFRRAPLGDSYLTRNGIDLTLAEEINQWQKPSSVLAFQIQRSSADGKKRDVQIEIPYELELPPEDFIERQDGPVAYQLSEFIVHRGPIATSGHYIAYLSKPDEKGQMHYFCCDDSRVSELSQEEFLNKAKAAYLLYFQKKDASPLEPF